MHDRHQHGPVRRARRASTSPPRQLESRLDQEIVERLAARRADVAPDTFEVLGRGELHLAVLIETMRREGYELMVAAGGAHEGRSTARASSRTSASRSTCPRSTSASSRAARAAQGPHAADGHHGDGRARIEYLVPARGLIGFRSQFLTETRGTGILHHNFEDWEPWHGELRSRPNGVSGRRPARPGDRRTRSTCRSAGSLFIAPGDEVYEGMIIGENSRDNDLVVNPSKAKKLTNIRAASADESCSSDPAAAALARAGARVHPRRRAGRGDAELDPTAQDRAVGVEAADDGIAREARARDGLNTRRPGVGRRRVATTGLRRPLPGRWSGRRGLDGRELAHLREPDVVARRVAEGRVDAVGRSSGSSTNSTPRPLSSS